MREELILPLKTVRAVADASRVAEPFEACGFVMSDGAVVVAANVADELHTENADAYPRTRESGFVMSVPDQLLIERSLDSSNPAVAVFHSHPGGVGAYFSAEDRERALAGGQPWYPLTQLVISASSGGGYEVRAYEFRGADFELTQTYLVADVRNLDDNTVLARVKLTQRLADFAGGVKTWYVEAATVGDAVGRVSAACPDLQERLWTGDGKLQRFVRLALEEDVTTAAAELHVDATITVLVAMAGG